MKGKYGIEVPAEQEEEYINYALRQNCRSINEYQELSERTMNDKLEPRDAINMLALGLAGEAGEVVDHIKKYLYHGHELDSNHVTKELGDVMWYIVNMASALGVDMNEILADNVAKLRKRYPDKFSFEASRNRKDE